MKRTLLPKTLFARNIALLIALVAVSQAFSLTVLLREVQKPRAERTAAVFASYIIALDALVATTPAETIGSVMKRGSIISRPELPVAAAIEPRPDIMRFYRGYQRAVFLRALRARLPSDMPVRWQSEGNESLWVRVHTQGGPLWLGLPMPGDAQASGADAAIVLWTGLTLLAALTAYLIQRHLNRPLRRLAQAARQVSAGKTPPGLPTDGASEIAEVSTAFNQMAHALEQANATRAMMLAGISHDIRTPLTKLRLAIAMSSAADDEGLAAAAESYFDQIDTILQQFMDFAGRGTREPLQPTDLNGLIEQLTADFAGLGHTFEHTLGNMPPLALRPVAMMRVLMNLMHNAATYAGSGLSIGTWTERKGENEYACVAVCDRGAELSPQELEALKVPFQRGRNAREHPGGTGLGLAIVERIVREHGGTLEFRSREGGGLEVRVVLPIRSGDADATPENRG